MYDYYQIPCASTYKNTSRIENACNGGQPTPPSQREGVPVFGLGCTGGSTNSVGSSGCGFGGGGSGSGSAGWDGIASTPGDHGAAWAVGPPGLTHLPGSPGGPDRTLGPGPSGDISGVSEVLERLCLVPKVSGSLVAQEQQGYFNKPFGGDA